MRRELINSYWFCGAQSEPSRFFGEAFRASVFGRKMPDGSVAKRHSGFLQRSGAAGGGVHDSGGVVHGPARGGFGIEECFFAELAGGGAALATGKAGTVCDRYGSRRADRGGARKRWQAASVLQRVPASRDDGDERALRARRAY